MATVKFKLRRDTAANWSASNPILALGEPGLETNTRKVKYGDGATPWNSLSYSAAGVVAFTDITGKPTNLSGYGITDAQPLDATLTALAAYNSNGFIVQAAADTFVSRSLAGTANEISIANPSGVGGNPTFSLPASLIFTGKNVTGGTFTSVTFAGTTTLPGGGTIDSSGYVTPGGSNVWTIGSKSGVVRVDYVSGAFRFLNAGGGFTKISASTANLSILPVYADNAAATAGGLVAGDLYRTATGVLMVRY